MHDNKYTLNINKYHIIMCCKKKIILWLIIKIFIISSLSLMDFVQSHNLRFMIQINYI